MTIGAYFKSYKGWNKRSKKVSKLIKTGFSGTFKLGTSNS